MDIEADERFGSNKRFYQRKGPPPVRNHHQPSSSQNRVCFHWLAGRCNRHPCSFLHSELPTSTGPSEASSKRPAGNLVWTNSSSANSGSSNWGRKVSGGGRPYKVPDRPCKNFIAGDGSCPYGDKCRYPHSWSMSDSFALLTPLKGHQQVVTGIALPSGSNNLYTVSKDGTLRVWDCSTGQSVGVFNLGKDIGCIISEGPWLFVGIPDSVKVWNTQSGMESSLSGPAGQVYAMVIGSDMLFAATQDGRILVWKFNVATNSFEPAASLSGHRRAVVSLVIGGARLYSGSMDNTIKAWDLTNLQCIQTLSEHSNVVMSLLCWDQFLLSASLDQTIRVWVGTEAGKLESTYMHTEDHGVLALCGMHDNGGKPVLLCSLNDNTVHLYDLPSFTERGKIFSREEVRSIQAGPSGLFFTGEGTGEVKVWKWNDASSS